MLLNSINLYLQKFIIILFFSISFQIFAQEIAVLKYNGGGDWYANPTAIPNLIEFSNKHTNRIYCLKTKYGFSNTQNYPPVFLFNSIIIATNNLVLFGIIKNPCWLVGPCVCNSDHVNTSSVKKIVEFQRNCFI